MYTSRHYGISDPKVIRDFVDRYSFGALLSNTRRGLMVTHLPMIWAAGHGEHGSLLGHMARANPQHAQTEEGLEVVAVFGGPSSYVSPLAYRDEPDVPTWNYQAAHLYGSWHVVNDVAAVHAHLEEMVARHEAAAGSDWTLDRLPPGFVEDLARGVTAFRIDITRAECAFKLSQDRTPNDRRGVIDWLEAQRGVQGHAVAAAMRTLYGC